jgi:hypothetical protein
MQNRKNKGLARLAKAASPSTTPEWLSETPTTEYCLTAQSCDNAEAAQDINLTLAEYEALKRHLAQLRGVTVPKARKNAA